MPRGSACRNSACRNSAMYPLTPSENERAQSKSSDATNNTQKGCHAAVMRAISTITVDCSNLLAHPADEDGLAAVYILMILSHQLSEHLPDRSSPSLQGW